MQRFSFVDKDRYLHKSFEEDALDPNVGTKLGKHYLSLDLCGLSKATKILWKLLMRKFTQKIVKPNISFYRKRQLVVTYKYIL